MCILGAASDLLKIVCSFVCGITGIIYDSAIKRQTSNKYAFAHNCSPSVANSIK